MKNKTLFIGDHVITLSTSFKVQVVMKAQNGTKLRMGRIFNDPRDAEKAFDSWAKTLERSK